MSDQSDVDAIRKARAALAALPLQRTYFPPDHVIHMSLDHADRRQSYSVARCDCGWVHRTPWPGHHVEVDAACEAHWQDVERAKTG